MDGCPFGSERKTTKKVPSKEDTPVLVKGFGIEGLISALVWS